MFKARKTRPIYFLSAQIIALFIALLGPKTLYAAEGQAGGGTALKAAIDSTKNFLLQNISGAEKNAAYSRLGRLLRLSGDIEEAAEAWLNAAYADNPNRDDASILEAAECYLAIGELDKADSNVKLVLLTTLNDRNIFLKAKFLAAQIDAFRTGSAALLGSLLQDGDFINERPLIYWTLWKLSGDTRYRDALLQEYPESPETLILSQNSGKNAVIEANSPQILLGPPLQ